MKKSYEQFKTSDIEEFLGLTITSSTNCIITDDIQPFKLSEIFKKEFFSKAKLALAINTEKARSELIISSILFELRKILNEKISFFSGTTFDVDASKGLKGRCDFLISLDQEQMILRAPVVALVEAKNDNISNGIGQCIAEMYASQIFNAKKGIMIPTIYGVITTGTNWRFLKITENKVCIENEDIYLESIELIFGILLDIIHKSEKFIKK
ncbi:MAG: hypothetical protein U5M51_08065 [Emticicia sp.]|nr:hypothetical protein [Emticicia sp.]